jgi:hypothetical protein
MLLQAPMFSKYQKATGFISFLQNNPDILLNPKRSIGISVGTTMRFNQHQQYPYSRY